MNIRPYSEKDYNMICAWWDNHNEIGPLPGMMPVPGSFICEINDEPIVALSVYLTSSNLAYIEGYISNPSAIKEVRNKCGEKLWSHSFDWAKEHGVKYLMTYSNKNSLVKRYEMLGMTASSLNNLTALYKTLGE